MASPADSHDEKKPDHRYLAPDDHTAQPPPLSPAESRETASRLVDDLELLRAERAVSNEEKLSGHRPSRSRTRHHEEPEDAFNPTAVANEETHTHKPPTALMKLWKKLRSFPRFVRYFMYMTPVAVLLLIPILLDLYAIKYTAAVGGAGGVSLKWFGIWLEVVWLSLWASRLLCSIVPYLMAWCAKLVGSSTPKKWRDIGWQLEFHAALFLWMLALIISFLPLVNSHRVPGGHWDGDTPPYLHWVDVVNKVIIALFVLACLNFFEKILIQWIAMSFHLRTYAYRIENNKQEIRYLITLYEYCSTRTHNELPWDPTAPDSSGTRTPLKIIQNNARQAWGKVGNVANRMAGDFTGRKVLNDDHPQKVVVELLKSTATANTLGRMLYRTFVPPGRDTVRPADLEPAFTNPDDAEACFGVFDKDMNGDISMEEFELVCNEIHLEKKAINASLKDLDSVIRKLDKVFLFIIVVIAAIVFVSIISGSAAAALGSAGTTILGFAWMLQATAQEFLQSIIFVFVKHPFDVGDRVTVYGNTGDMMRGDDYYVQEISLLYTEFKKMQGHVVQAPNSLLNNLFILNQRRSNGLADVVELKMRFGTPNEVIEELKARMVDFVTDNKRDYAPRVITEVRTIEEVWAITVNFVFFHKTSFQNELLRLQRHNKLATELMIQMKELGIEGPRKMQPGGNRDYPFYWTNLPPPPSYSELKPGHADAADPVPVLEQQSAEAARQRRRRAESQPPRVVVDDAPDFQDVFDTRKPDALRRLQSLRAAGAARAAAGESSQDRLPGVAERAEEEGRASASGVSIPMQSVHPHRSGGGGGGGGMFPRRSGTLNRGRSGTLGSVSEGPAPQLPPLQQMERNSAERMV
ncbi:uncharacterized protein E0L32_006198 [Thyridium curvatum]|uniref:Mechanosensitive ion channel protein n=1 Tax=Thyridium curvatum TaxID=1093900 RepID=A0A507B9L4_9PEZI|nr:uncharacterized protein E0L32_006198 [Thyridium curvatum]TPX13468.1 hypothetical protein E0L32_006198 [Thyridium curvatum]